MMEKNSMEPPTGDGVKRRRGIYLLPNLFTTACLFSGFYSIISAINGQFENAAMAIFVAMVLDGLDGRVARMTNTQSDFGAQYDSLADMVSFGLAPALVVYLWAFADMGKLGWLVAFVFVASAALRLARFNTQVGVADKRYFQGLASPAAAAVIAGLVWVSVDFELPASALVIPAYILTLASGLLMVSNIRFRSFKDIDLKGKVPFFTILVVVVIFVSIAVDPPLVLFAVFLLYASSGVVSTILGRNKLQAKSNELKSGTETKPETQDKEE